jgi:hypothetical protein
MTDGRMLWPKEISSKYKLKVSLYACYLLFYSHDIAAYI